nr:integrase, catalytic region, zinc finger, CCHC-type, peptidase aspartic, catalytic [Tanacetum cinerariifolium]
MALLRTQIQKQCYNKHTAPTTQNKRQDYLPSNEMVRQCRIRLERADTRKEVAIIDATCYNYKRQCHYSRNYPYGKVRDKSYVRVKMLLAAKKEKGRALTTDKNDFYAETDDEGEQIEANVVFMAILEKMEAFETKNTSLLRIQKMILNSLRLSSINELGSELTFFAGSELGLASYMSKNWVNILKSIDEGPFKMGTLRETLTGGTEDVLHLGPERPRVYSDLTSEDKDRYNANIRATNTLLQGLPKDIYSLINHYTDANDIWDNVKMLLEGSELTKEDRESQLYDDFEHFRQYKGETIREYYGRFAKIINDIWNIKMTMSRIQLNSKFVNNMLPEWGRFVTAVKLNRESRDSNYDQLYAYLKQWFESFIQIISGKSLPGSFLRSRLH